MCLNRHIRYKLFIFLTLALLCQGFSALAKDVYGPINLLKVLPNPFAPAKDIPAHNFKSTRENNKEISLPLSLLPEQPIVIKQKITSHHLSECLRQSRLYLPEKMCLGRTAEFIVTGKPGAWAALAMADKDTGAKPIYGHALHLGADRKLVALGQIPNDGILHLVIETPIEGDLIDQYLFFEAAVWSQPDFSDLEIAMPFSLLGKKGINNGVAVEAEMEVKNGIKIVPDATMPTQRLLRGDSNLNFGQP